jgi:hypothetical protein
MVGTDASASALFTAMRTATLSVMLLAANVVLGEVAETLYRNPAAGTAPSARCSRRHADDGYIISITA